MAQFDNSGCGLALRPQQYCGYNRQRHQAEIVSGAHPGAGARIAYTRAMSEHRRFPKKRLSTHTMHFK